MIRPALCLLATSALICAAAVPAAMAENMRAGKWQTTITMQEQGQAPSTMNMTQCMSQQEIEAQAKGGLAGREDDFEMNSEEGGCKHSMRQKGGIAEIISDCNGEKSVSTMQYTAEGFTMKTTSSGAAGNSTTTVEGKRVGDC